MSDTKNLPPSTEETASASSLPVRAYRTIIEAAPDIVALIDAQGQIRYANAKTENVLGYARSHVEGRNIFEFVHPDDSSRAALEYENTLQTNGERIPSVLRLRSAAGEWIPFEIIANNRLGDPDLQAVVFTARDLRFREDIEHAIHSVNVDTQTPVEQRVTELARINAELRIENQARRQAEIRLQHLVSLLNSTLDSTADGILVVSTDGNVTTCNTRFCEMWRIECALSTGKSDHELLADVMDQLQSPNEFIEKVQTLYSDPSATSFDILHFKDGRIFERYSQPQWLGNTIVGRVWSFRDVTRARNLESELRQSQKMEALGRLAGGIAHDFNNLLMLVTGYTNQMLENPALAQAHSNCEQILKITKRAASVTRQLLTFSRKLPDVPVKSDLSVIVLDVERMIRRLMSDQIHLQVVAWRDPLPVYVDVAQIEVVVVNLAINAQDAMPNGGLLSIATLQEEADGSRYAVLQVTDTGHGMTKEVRAHIFEPFYTTKQLGKGTGLGLSTVFGIVERFGGFIRFESEVNRGTTFRVYLPYSDNVSAAKTVEAAAESRGGEETILLAEDEEGIRAMTRVYLEGLGYRVLEASDGAEAIQRSREYGGPIDLVLSDILMPGIRGDAAVAEIRRSRPHLKAIYISGYTDQSDHNSVVEGILFKPFDFPELGRRIRAVLDDPE